MDNMHLSFNQPTPEQQKPVLERIRELSNHPKIRGLWLNLMQTFIAILAALIVGACLLLIIGANPIEAYGALFKGALGSWPALARTLRTATPLIFTGLAVVVAFRAGYIFLGMEGSLYFGALSAALFGIYLAPGLPAFLHLPLSMLAGFLAGGLWALFPAALRARWKVDEVVSTLMLNYVAVLLVDHLVYSFFQDPTGGTNAERAFTVTVPESSRLPFLSAKYGLTWAILIGAVLAVVLVWIYSRGVWGFESDMTGFNRKFAHYGGVNTIRMAIVSMVLAGAIAGLGGTTESLGNYGRYISGFSSDFGFSGVTVALMGRLDPIGTLFGAFFFGALSSGGAAMELVTDIPRDMVVVLQGLIMLVVTAQAFFSMLRLSAKARPEE
jgi:simple sugar transport system permease protein